MALTKQKIVEAVDHCTVGANCGECVMWGEGKDTDFPCPFVYIAPNGDIRFDEAPVVVRNTYGDRDSIIDYMVNEHIDPIKTAILAVKEAEDGKTDEGSRV